MEVAVAMAVLSVVMVGIIALLIQSRRLTEESIAQNSANTVIQGYIEQMKSMPMTDLPYYTASGTLKTGAGTSGDANHSYYNYTSDTLLPGPQAGCSATNEIVTQVDAGTTDPLFISSGNPPNIATLIPGTAAPAGVVDNVKLIDINQTQNVIADDLQLRVWVWIQDLSGSAIDVTQVRSITIVYQFRVKDGNRKKYLFGTVRTIRSNVS